MRSIETERLLLRDFVEDDWSAIDAILTDTDATRYMHFAKWTAERRREWFS